MTAFDTQEDKLLTLVPDHEVNTRETFGVDFDMKAPAFTSARTSGGSGPLRSRPVISAPKPLDWAFTVIVR